MEKTTSNKLSRISTDIISLLLRHMLELNYSMTLCDDKFFVVTLQLLLLYFKKIITRMIESIKIHQYEDVLPYIINFICACKDESSK